MLEHIKQFLVPPIFVGEEDKTRTAQVLNAVLLSLMVVLLLAGIATLFVFAEKLGSLLVIIVLASMLFATRFMMARGRVRGASTLLVTGLWVGVTVLVSLAGGMTSIDAAYYIMITVIAGLSLGSRAAPIVAGVCSLTGLGMIIMESTGHPLPRVFPVPAISGWLNLTFGLFLATMALNIMLRSLHDALALARQQLGERQKAEEALRASEEKFSKAFYISPDSVNINRLADGLFLEINQGFTSLTGYTPQDVAGRTSLDLDIWTDPADRARLVQGLRAHGEVSNLEARFRRKNGDIEIGLMSAVLMDLHGEKCILSVTRDITERKRAEVALRESEQRFRTIFDSVNDAIFVHDLASGDILDVNQTTCAMYGYTREEARRLSVEDLSAGEPPHTQQDALAWIKQATVGAPQLFEWRARHRDGRLFWVEVNMRRAVIGGQDRLLVVVRDISERKRAEEKLRANEDRFRSLVQNLADVITIYTPEGTISYESSSAVRVLGYEPGHLIGRNPFEFIHPDDHATAQQALSEVVQRANPGTPTEFRFRRGDGVWINLEAVGTNLMDHPGIRGIVITARDISERKRAELALQKAYAEVEQQVAERTAQLQCEVAERKQAEQVLRERERQVRGILDNMQDVYFRVDPQERFLLMSPSAPQVYGYDSVEELMTVPVSALYFNREDRQKLLAEIQTSGRVHDYLCQGRKKDGSPFWVSMNVQLVRDEHGQVVGTEGAIRDITEREQAEAALRESEQRFRTLFEQAAVGVALLETQTGRYVRINQKYCDFLDYTMEEMLQRTFQDVTCPEDTAANDNYNALLIEGRISEFSLEKRYVRKDGRVVWGNLTASPLWKPGENPDVYYHIAIVEDITERKQAGEALRRYADQLAAQNAELDAFAHTVAHDLKNPLGIIVGYAGLVADDYATMPPEEMSDSLRRILRAANKLNTIIEELMLLTGVRKQEIVPAPLDMGNIVREAVERLEVLVREHNARITLPDEIAWPAALGYAPWVEEVWANYISNACKYGGRPPQITVGADLTCLQNPSGQAMARFWVQDNGPGLSVMAQSSLFTPFTRLAQTRATGHGLGLSIVRRIVEKLGGEVGVESDGIPGHGSTFFFTLPASK